MVVTVVKIKRLERHTQSSTKRKDENNLVDRDRNIDGGFMFDALPRQR